MNDLQYQDLLRRARAYNETAFPPPRVVTDLIMALQILRAENVAANQTLLQCREDLARALQLVERMGRLSTPF